MPGEPTPGAGMVALWGEGSLTDLAAEVGLPVGRPGAFPSIDPADGTPVARECREVAVLPAVRRLAALPPRRDWPRWRRPSDSLLAWSLAAKLALEAVAAGHLVPLLRTGRRSDEAVAVWRVATGDERWGRLADALPPAGRLLRGPDGRPVEPLELLAAFADAVADVCARQGRRTEIDPRRRGPRSPWPGPWLSALAGSDPVVDRLRVPAEELVDEVLEWAAPVLRERRRTDARLALRLEPRDDERWRLALLLDVDGDRRPAAEVWDAGGALEVGTRVVEDPAGAVAAGLADAARLYPPLARTLEEAAPTVLDLTLAEVADLLDAGVAALGDAGITVLVPPELRDLRERRLRARIRVGRDTSVAGRVLRSAGAGMQDLVAFEYEAAVGDRAISDEEFAELVARGEPLVKWRGEWIRIDARDVDRVAELAGSSGSLALTEALAAALAGTWRVEDEWVDTVADGALADLVGRLESAARVDEPANVRIKGDLRAYQERGIAWMQQLLELGMGAVLADDMGLGKTVQAIGLFTSRPGDRPQLVVCPTSVVGNWRRELERFAPWLTVETHHGPERADRRSAFRPGRVVVTTYALLRRDVDLLEDIDWDLVVFDEAQQIKNAASKGARAARSLVARAKIAMTGTPIENRLSELWSILELTTPGLLGSQQGFNRRFAAPIERWHDEEAATSLRRLIAPFVLRREKSDPDVAVDLPPKHEIEIACSLTREQATLYRSAVDRAFSDGLGSTAFERRGRILALLTALKQICNHPAQFLRDGGALAGRSGKLARLTETLQEVLAAGDRALVFTQFREMGDLLVDHLGRTLEVPEVPFLHGGVPAGRRDRMVDRFQNAPDAPPVFVVSLRAGGVGLNLTRASTVVHYDRWWNPAVEDQATDRVHRIGQDRPVTVVQLVTGGTLEERIAGILERKRSLASSVIGAGETWITELDDGELRELVTLSQEDVEDGDAA